MTSALVASGVDPDVSAALAIYERIKPLKASLGIENLTDSELQVFAYVARFTGLDPFTKQIYAIKRGGRVTHQTGIDGYRSIAERSSQYAGSEEATYEACDCAESDSPKDHPRLARVDVRRVMPGGQIVKQTGVARWHELKPGHFKPQGARDFLDAMWWQQPYNQLGKCAEANGLRKAFPRVLGGVYIADEMQGPAMVEGEYREVTEAPARPTVADRVAARRAATEPSAEPQEAATEPPVEAEAAIVGTGEPTADAQSTDAAGIPDTAGAASPEPTVKPSARTSCGNGSPYGDGQSCNLAAGHEGLHRVLDGNGKPTVSWELDT